MKNPWDINEEDNNNKNHEETNKNIDNGSVDEFVKILLDNFQKHKKNSNNDNKIKSFVIMCFSLFLLVWLFNGVYEVNSDENAVVTYFGKYYETTKPGLHFYIPYPIGEVKKIKITVINKEEFGFVSSANGKKAIDEESLMLTGDENIADIDFEVQWRIGNVENYLFNIKNQQKTIRSATESVMREIIANRDIDDVLADKKSEIELQAKNLLQGILNSYNSGVEIVSVQLLRADPPKEVINSFRDVQTAKADKERKINEAEAYKNDIMPKARGEAEALIQNAEAYKKAVISNAEGDATRFNKLYEQYKNNRNITRKRIYIDTMEEVMRNNNKVIMDKDINTNLIQLFNNN